MESKHRPGRSHVDTKRRPRRPILQGEFHRYPPIEEGNPRYKVQLFETELVFERGGERLGHS